MAGPPRYLRGNGSMLDAERLPREQAAKRLGAERFPYLGAGYDDVDAAVGAAWYGQRHVMSWIRTAHEPSLWRAIADGEPYPVRALIVQHHNPLGANANAAAVERALRSGNLELSVVQDLLMTPTARLADYVLPAAHWLEKPYFSLGIAFLAPAGDYVAGNRAAIAPEAEHRSDYDLWRDLGRRLGQGEEWPETAEAFYEACVRPAGLDFAALCAARGPLMGEAARRADGSGPLPDAPRYGTPSGKVELRSSLLERWGLPGLPTDHAPAVFAADGDYPCLLTTGGRSIEAFHENAHNMSRFRRQNPEPYATLHPATAARAGIADGDWMRITTPIGSVRQIARLTTTLAEDVVRADRWWYPERADDAEDPFGFHATNINLCTADDDASIDPVMGAWLLRALPCRIAPAERPTPD
jgi:anaerobic selenocysteine-containing dehydrogenase